MKTLQDYIDKLNKLNFKEMYENDFFLTWEKTDEELEAVWTVADALRFMRENNISTKVFLFPSYKAITLVYNSFFKHKVEGVNLMISIMSVFIRYNRLNVV